jgi:hypothetical protein
MAMSKQTLKEKGLTPTDCANLYVRYCLQNLPYNADAFAEVVDCASLTGTKYKAVEKALQTKLVSLIKKMDKSLGMHGPGASLNVEVIVSEPKPADGPDAI